MEVLTLLVSYLKNNDTNKNHFKELDGIIAHCTP